jgi:tripartite-type tricarboxylate transporter receptor subunit TctC
VAILSHVKSGKVRAIATSGPRRSVALPDLPTVMEAGVPGYAVTSWFGVAAPARTPPDAIGKLHGALTAALRERDTLEKIAAEGAEPAPGTPEDFDKLLAAELSTWAKVIKAAGLQ